MGVVEDTANAWQGTACFELRQLERISEWGLTLFQL